MPTKRRKRSTSDGGDGGFWFDEEAADRAVEFFETCLTHVKGELAGQAFTLDPWQRDEIIRPAFGWKRPDGTRKYRVLYVEIPRKSGKSTLCAGIALYLTLADREAGSEVYSAAADREQAAIVFDVAKQMVAQSDVLRARLEVYRRSMAHLASASSYKVISADAYCLRSDTLLDKASGETVRAEDVHPGDRLIGWDGAGLADAVVRSTRRETPVPVYRIRTHRGREIVVTGNHPFLTMRHGRLHKALTHVYEWKRTADIRAGDRIRIALGWPGRDGAPSEEAWALGAWAGDGECGRFRFVNVDDAIVQRLRRFIETLGCSLVSAQSTRQKQQNADESDYPHEHTLIGFGRRRASPAREWVRCHFGQEARSATKDVPTAVLRGGPGAWASFLAGYLDTDGCVPVNLQSAIWASNSHALMRSCQTLLARLGINAALSGSKHYRLTVSGGEQLRRLNALLGPHLSHPGKSQRLAAASAQERRRGFNAHDTDTVVDVTELPPEITISIEVDAIDTHVTNGLISHNTKHGFNAHGIVVDELHAQRNRDLVDVLKTSTGARRQPLEVYITTAGYDRNSICWEMHDYAIKVRDGLIDDPSFLPLIYAADEKDDWRDPKVWAKANPGLGISVSREYFERECKRAQEVAGYENTFKRLHLNLWTQQDTRWIQIEEVWDPCGTPVDWASLKGRRAWGGVDLSTTTDITALVFLVEDPDGEHFDVVPFFWMPVANVRKRVERDRVPYDVFIRDGAMLTTEGNVVDYEAVRIKVNEVAEHLQIVDLPIDRWNSTQLQTQLQGDGFTIVPFGQGFASMSAPTKELERLLLDRKLRHGGHPVLRWMASNVAVSQDPAGNIKPAKDKSTERIDGIVALIMAIGRMTAAMPENEPQYQVMFLG